MSLSLSSGRRFRRSLLGLAVIAGSMVVAKAAYASGTDSAPNLGMASSNCNSGLSLSPQQASAFGIVGEPMTVPAPTISGFTSAPTFSSGGVSPLPAGLSMDASTGSVTGTPTATGYTNFVAEAQGNNENCSYQILFYIQADRTCMYAQISPAEDYGSGTVGTPLTVPAPQPDSAFFTNGPVTFTVLSGILPAGLSLNSSTGSVTGTPTQPANGSVVVFTVSDGAHECEWKITFSIMNSYTPPPMPPSCTTGAPSSNASGVTFDSNFGTSGVWTPVESGKSIMIFDSIVGNDGKGYVLATVETPMSYGTAVSRLYRLNTDGSSDSTWGTNGFVDVPGNNMLQWIVQGSNGSFSLGGSTYSGQSSVPVLVRLTSTGALDTSWGNSGTVSFPAPPSGSSQNLASLAAGPSGSLYALVDTGNCGQNGCVSTYSTYRVTSAGAIDTNFGTNGALTVTGRYMRTDSTGAIYVWNSDWNTGTSTMTKFDASGSVAGSFGTSGALAPGAEISDAEFIGTHMYLLMSVRVSSGDMNGPPSYRVIIARYDRTTGALDANFANAGVSTVFAPGGNMVSGFVALSDGSFVVLGNSFAMSGPAGWLQVVDSAGTPSTNLPSTGATFTSGSCTADNLRGGAFIMGGSFFAFGGKYQMGNNAPMGFKFTISGVSAPVTTAPATTAPATTAPATTAPATTAPATTAPATTAPVAAPATTAPATTAPVAAPTLVNSSNQATLTQQPGSATALVNGQPVTPAVETPANLPAAQVDPEDRSPAEVQSLQTAADDLVSQLNQLAGGSSGLAVVDTPTGANLTGLLTVPVPIENTVLVEAGNMSALFAGLNQDGSVTDVLPGAVIEVMGRGQMGILASGLTPGEGVEFVVMSTPTLLGTFTVAANGTINGQVSLPSNIALGNHTLVVASPTVQSSLGLKVSMGALPATGSDVSKPLVVALWLLVGGGFVAVIRRRLISV